jgi:hypothetical protein
MNGGSNATANRTRQNKVVYLNRNFVWPPEHQVFYTHTGRSGECVNITRAGSSRIIAKCCTSCQRTRTARIRRSPAVRREFQRENPCPSTGCATGACPGYVFDHVVPLKRGGHDAPATCNGRWSKRRRQRIGLSDTNARFRNLRSRVEMTSKVCRSSDEGTERALPAQETKAAVSQMQSGQDAGAGSSVRSSERQRNQWSGRARS